MKFGLFYEHQLPRPWSDDAEYDAAPRRARAVRARRRARLRLRVGGRAPLPRGVQPLERARGLPRRASRSGRSACGSATASCRRRPASTIPARVAERIATLDLVSGGRVDFGTGESSSEAELGGFLHRPGGEARHVGGGPARRAPLPHRVAVHGAPRAVGDHAAAQRRPEAAPEAASAGLGGVQPPRHDPPRGAEGHRRADVRLRRSRGRAALGGRLLRDARARGRADRRRGQRERRLRLDVHVPPRRGRGDAARARGGELLRLLARALLRVRPPPARADRRVGGVPAAARASTATIRRRCARRRRTRIGSAPRSSRAASPGSAAPSARRTRCASTSAATRRRASTR